MKNKQTLKVVLILIFIASLTSASEWIGSDTSPPQPYNLAVLPYVGSIQGTQYNWVTEYHPSYQAYFRNNTNTANSVFYQKGDYYFIYDVSGSQLLWKERIGQPSASSTLGGGCSSNTLDTQAMVIGSNVSYPSAFCNTTLTYAISSNMVKENFILYGLPSIKDYLYLAYGGHIYFNKSLDICANDQCYTPSGTEDNFITSGQIDFRQNNETIFYLKEPIIYDSAGHTSIGRYYVRGSNAQMIFELRINQSFLASATYPVYIDPTWITGTLSPGSAYNIQVTDFKYNFTITNATVLVPSSHDWGGASSPATGTCCSIGTAQFCNYCDNAGQACTGCTNGNAWKWYNASGNVFTGSSGWDLGNVTHCSSCVTTFSTFSSVTARYLRVTNTAWDNAFRTCSKNNNATGGISNYQVYGTDAQYPNVTLNSPLDSTTNSTTVSPILFLFNVTNQDYSLYNMTLVIYNGSSSIYKTNTTLISGSINKTIVSLNLVGGSYKWNAYTCDEVNLCTWGVNRTLNIVLGNGANCTANNQCNSGNCVDNICCDSSVCSSCLSCNVSGHLGVCYYVPQGQADGTSCNTNNCGTGTCNGIGDCEWYTSGERNCNTCQTCNGATSTSCVNLANNIQDTEGTNLCNSTCKKCSSGACVNQGNEDLFNQCDTLQCDGDAVTPYFWGFDGLTCNYRTDVNASNANCDGSGSCLTTSYYCPIQPMDGSTGIVCDYYWQIGGCSNTISGTCLPYIRTFTTNNTDPYNPPLSNGKVTFTANITNGTGYSLDKWWFTYNGTFGNITSAVDGVNQLVWSTQNLNLGNYSIIAYANTTGNYITNSSVIWVYIHNNTAPQAVNVSISNAPIKSGDNATCGCDCSDIDYLYQNTFIKNFAWYVNQTDLGINSTTIFNGNYTSGDQLTCGCQCFDGLVWGTPVNSSTLVVGDNIPPYNSSTPIISNSNPCSTATSIVSINATDNESQIGLVQLNAILPIIGNVDLPMSCGVGNSVQCIYVFSGYDSTILLNQIDIRDANDNSFNVTLNTSITYHTCQQPSTGGGGGLNEVIIQSIPTSCGSISIPITSFEVEHQTPTDITITLNKTGCNLTDVKLNATIQNNPSKIHTISKFTEHTLVIPLFQQMTFDDQSNINIQITWVDANNMKGRIERILVINVTPNFMERYGLGLGILALITALLFINVSGGKTHAL